MSWLNRIERRLQPLAIPHLLPAILLGQVFFYLCRLLGLLDLSPLDYSWAQTASGDWWRVFTFILYPPDAWWVFYAFCVACTYFLGSVLEHEWGTLRFNLFLIVGWLLTVLAGVLVPSATMTNTFIAGSVMLAFAYYNPDYVFRLYFVFPVRAKFLALGSLAFVTASVVVGDWAIRLSALASVANYLIFLGPSMWRDAKSGRRRMAWHAKLRAERRETAAAGPRHRCVVCGKNSETHPHEDFRYRADDNCYCEAHRQASLVGPPKS